MSAETNNNPFYRLCLWTKYLQGLIEFNKLTKRIKKLIWGIYLMQLSRIIFICFTLTAMAGCATYSGVPYERDVANVQSVAIATPTLPEKATVQQIASVGSSFGLIGAMVDAGVAQDRNVRFREIISNEEYNAEEKFQTLLTETVTQRGYAVSKLSVERENQKLLEDYPNTEEDAILDVVSMSYGYLSA
ncbi:MAG: hypothetical protein AAF723_02760, partial [Pseudomonadota bacterium]